MRVCFASTNRKNLALSSPIGVQSLFIGKHGERYSLGFSVSAVSGAVRADFDAQDAPVVRYSGFTRALGRRARIRRAFEPFAEDFRIRARIDGVLHEVARPDLNLREQLTVRLKNHGAAGHCRKRLPQDGRLKLTITPNQSVDCRISTLANFVR